MSALLAQLQQLHTDLHAISARDAEQEVMGLALPLVDKVLSEAKGLLPAGHGLATQIVDLVSVEGMDVEEGIRAADAVIVVGQVLAAYKTLLAEQTARDAEAIDADRALLPRFLDLLPPDGAAVRHMRDHQFDMIFAGDDVIPLREYAESWTRPGQRFQSARLRPLDEEFRSALDELNDHTGTHTFILRGNPSERRVYPEFDLDWEDDRNRFVFDAIREGNAIIGRAYRAYETLVNEAGLALK